MSADRPALSKEAERLLDARNEAITELKAIDGVERTITDPHVIRLSVARLFEQSVTMRMLSGEPISASELKNATDMVAAAREAIPSPPIEVKLTIVRRTAAELEGPYAPTRAEPKPSTPKLLPPPVIDGEVVEHSTKPTADVPAASAAPVYPKKDPATLGIHDARLPNGQPARMRRNDYSGINAGGVYNPLEKAPDWDAKRPVPETFWPVVG